MADWRKRVLAATAVVHPEIDGKVLGTAFLIDDDMMLTCRHVVTVNGKPNGPLRQQVIVVFPGQGPRYARPLQNEALPETVDAVVLQLGAHAYASNNDGAAGKAPAGTGRHRARRPVRLSGSSRRPSRVVLLGYPAVDATLEGVWETYSVQGPTAGEMVQLTPDNAGSWKGHSGGPVVDDTSEEVVGVLSQGWQTGQLDRYIPLTLILRHRVLHRLPWLMDGQDAAGHFASRSTGQRGSSSGADVFADVFKGREAALATLGMWLQGEPR